MNKKTRLTILAICFLLFFVVAPYIIAYSLGYRIDFKQKKIVATGGIYVRVVPQGADVIIDSKIENKTSLFSPTVFVQNLLPAKHTVLVKKDGYFDYNKSLDVEEKEVVKLEDIVLFKQNLTFEALQDKTKSPFIEPKVVEPYVLKNKIIYKATALKTPLIKNVAYFKLVDSNIYWLGTDGNVNKSDLSGKLIEKLTTTPITVNTLAKYEILNINKFLFLKEDAKLLLYNTETKDFEAFYNWVSEIKIAPDNQTLMFYNDNEIFVLRLDIKDAVRKSIYQTNEKITECIWLNDHYILFTHGNSIKISEIDYRNGINVIELQKEIVIPTLAPITITSPKVIFNQQDKKLYIQTNDSVYISERLIP